MKGAATVALVPLIHEPRWLRPVARGAYGIYAAFVVFVFQAGRNGHSWAWLHSSTLQLWLASALGGLTFVGKAYQLLAPVIRRPGVEQHRQFFDNVLGQIIVTIHEMTGDPVKDLGCSLWFRQPRFLRRAPQLIRFDRKRLTENTYMSNVTFTKGKGTVGQCWDKEAPAYFDWRKLNKRHGAGITDHAWNHLSDNGKRGFDRHDFESMCGKYAEIKAVPISVDGKLEGVISLDRRWNKDDPQTVPVMHTDAVEGALNTAAATVRDTLSKQQ